MPDLRILGRLRAVEGQFGSHFSVLMSVHLQILAREIGHHIDNADILSKVRERDRRSRAADPRAFPALETSLCLRVEGVGRSRLRGS